MLLNRPEMAKNETIMFRHMRKLHEDFITRLGTDSLETLRATAWQIELYLEEHGKFKDSEFLRTLQQIIEYVVQQKCGTRWTVHRAKYDLRGRTRGINQWAKMTAAKKRAPVPGNLSQSLNDRLIVE